MESHANFDEFLETIRDKPVFVILGVQGSGTNLLSRLLVRIFGFSVMRDRSSIFNAAARLGSAPRERDILRELRRFRTSLAPSRFDRVIGTRSMERAELFDGIFRYLTPASVRSGSDFARLVYAYRAFSLRARHLAIKSDDLWEHIDQMDAVLPNRRIILLTRDFRDNLVSIGGKHFGPIEPICAARYIKRQFELYEAEYRRAARNRNGYHVSFQTLVEEPRRFVDDFARHFSIEPVVDPGAVLQSFPFRPNKMAKWKQLSKRDLAWCEGILHDQLVAFEYEPVFPHVEVPGIAAIAAATVRDAVRRCPQKLRQVAIRLKN